MKILLKIAYDGRGFCGWQVQKNGKSVQETLCSAAYAVYGKEVKVTGCSRTDSGVHARCFFCTLTLSGDAPDVPEDKLPAAFNCRLPETVTVYRAKKVKEEFHPRYDVVSKTYEYLIDNGSERDPFLYERAWNVKRRLDEKIMDEAAKRFVGKFDFSAFMASGSDVKDTVRTVFSAGVRREGEKVIFSVTADGFLYNMVRIMTGTLTEVSDGRIAPDDIPEIISKGQRKNAGRTAPPDGLYLCDVKYVNGEEKI